MMRLEILLSCMNETEFSVINRSNLKNVNTLIINQCNENKEFILDDRHRVINTTTRGLSVSRNIGIEKAKGDICLLSDDDELFHENLEQTVLNAYEQIKDADIIIFKISNREKAVKEKIRRLKKVELLKVSSVQISFKRESVVGKISFDPFLGAGTPNGAGEENKFLLDCYRSGLRIYYYPIDILTLTGTNSSWFSGFNEDYFYKRGYTTRYIYGLSFAVIYAIYFVISKRKIYRNIVTPKKAAICMYKGIKDNCIKQQKSNEENKMKIFLLGDFETNNGPAIANREMKEAIRRDFKINYSNATGKIKRIVEMYVGVKRTDILLICSKSKINYMAVKLAKRKNKKIIYLMHGYASYEYKIENPNLMSEELKKIYEYEQFIFDTAEKIVCVSRHCMNYMKSEFPMYANKFDYTYNVVDIDKIENKHRDRSDKNYQIMSVGGGMRQKNILTLVRAVNQLKQNVKVMVVGKTLSDGEEIRQYANVIWFEHLPHDKLIQFMSESNIYIQNSIFETFGISVIEALFAGCSLLLSNAIGCLDLFENLTDMDIIYNVFDENEIAIKIDYLLKNPNNERLVKSFNKEYITTEWQANRWKDIIGEIVSNLEESDNEFRK